MKRLFAVFLIVLIAISCCSCKQETTVKRKKQKMIEIIRMDSDSSEQDTDSESDYTDNDSDDSDEWDDWDDWDDSDDWDDLDDEEERILKNKATSSNIGNGYYVLFPKYEHPGVVGMDAEYDFLIYDKMGYRKDFGEFTLSCSDKKVKIAGAKVTVPYELRKSDNKLTIRLVNNSYPNRTGSYTFSFRDFSAQPALEDNFDTFDQNKWYYETEGDTIVSKAAKVESGKLVLTANEKGDTIYLSSSHKQAFGCLSASILMPAKGLSQSKLSLGTYEKYISNKKSSSDADGEITVAQYSPYWQDLYSASVRWHGTRSFKQVAENSDISVKAISQQYHTYSVVWLDNAIFWYVDGKVVFCHEGGGVSKTTGELNVRILLQSYSEDNQVFGPFAAGAFPITVKYDWLKLYRLL